MKKILGLDLGIASIGWALLSENNNHKEILALGTRIIPLTSDDKDEFSKGNAISKNQNRTTKRTQRKGYDRYQLRRDSLKQILYTKGMFPDAKLFSLSSLELYKLRSDAAKEKITLNQLGRVLYLMNQKRGYKSSRTDANLNKKDTDYVAEVKGRHQHINDLGFTIGQYFYEELKANEYYRIKQQVFPREAYVEEFEKICKEQKKYYPDILTDEFIDTLKKEIIYFQRKLKSQKGLVSICEFEGRFVNDKDEKQVFVGPKVAPKSSPLFQVCKIWETINTITVYNKKGETYIITTEQKQKLFDYLDNNDQLTQPKLFELLGLKREDGWYGNKQTLKGIQGNLTKTSIQKILCTQIGFENLLQFNLTTEFSDKKVYLVNKKNGEITAENATKVIAKTFEQEELYRLWHTIYSIADIEECSRTLQVNFSLPVDLANRLAILDFKKSAFGNKSAKAMRKIIPYLVEGYVYSNAASFAGYNHSDSLTKEENLQRPLVKLIPNLSKNSLRQPIVEKILNQMINLVNAVIAKHGSPDEIRIELARELKQSKDERNETFVALNKREREGKAITDRIGKEYAHLGVRATRNTIIKWRLFHEINNYESKINATCIYCGNQFGITDALKGDSVDVEHIIPKSRLFDDSQSNKTLVHRKCNENKGDKTAYDFMESKGAESLYKYLETINVLYKNRVIGKTKRDKLLMQGDQIPKNFIDRQLRETQYIARKSKEILESVCYNVWSTSGNVTEYLRRIWGWDDVLMNLQLPKHQMAGLTELKEWETNDGHKHSKLVIKDWSKRNDHRHHAIDALAIACTQQGFIQRINTLSSQHTRNEMYVAVEKQNKEFREKLSLLDRYMVLQRPFTTAQVEVVASKILISFKAGKKVATISKYKATGKNLLTGVIVPRGPLSEESVYGKIKIHNKEHYVIKYKLGIGQGCLFSGKEAIKTSKKGKEKDQIQDVLNSIVDKGIRDAIRKRLEEYNNNPKDAFKNLESDPVFINSKQKIPIVSIRCFTGLSAVEPVQVKNDKGEILYEKYVKSGNNHHLAIYRDETGKIQDHMVTFWHAVERKKYGLPIIITDPAKIWDIILNKEDLPQSFLEKLPNYNWTYSNSMQENEMFVFDMTTEELNEMISKHDFKSISNNLYRFQKTESGYKAVFRHHLATTLDKKIDWKGFSTFNSFNGIKVKINNIGEIISIEK